jgi:hypothetical protein
MLTVANDGEVSFDFEGPYREWTGQSDTCFSPEQNVAVATSDLGFGCACDRLTDVSSPCLMSAYDEDPTAGYVFFMYCDFPGCPSGRRPRMAPAVAERDTWHSRARDFRSSLVVQLMAPHN